MPTTKSRTSESLEKVPPFPPVAAKLLAILSHPDVEVREVAQLIGMDATFTARLLRCVNSYEFGLVSPVTNIQQAVAIAGLDRTRQITVTQAAAAYTKGALKTEELRRCWQHSIATAVLSGEIALACGQFVNEAFTAGIMHDIGRLGLVVAYPDRYEAIIRNAAAQCLDLLDFEQEEFGANHAEAGRYLAERWGLPDDLRIVAGRHHDASDGGELDLVQLVHVACRLADALGYDVTRPLVPVSPNTVLRDLPFSARQHFTKSPQELCVLIEEQIREFDADPTHVPPNVELPPEVDTAAASDGAPEHLELLARMEEPSPVEQSSTLPADPPPISMVVTIAWAIAAIAAVIALLIWKLR